MSILPLVVIVALVVWCCGQTGLAGDILDALGRHRVSVRSSTSKLVAISGGLAILVGVPLGTCSEPPALRKAADSRHAGAQHRQHVPTLAVLALAMSLLGIGTLPAIFALWVAIAAADRAQHLCRHARRAAALRSKRRTGWACGRGRSSRRVELPNALFVMFAGIRTALAINVGTAPLAFLIGGGGLGELIFTGIDLNEPGHDAGRRDPDRAAGGARRFPDWRRIARVGRSRGVAPVA